MRSVWTRAKPHRIFLVPFIPRSGYETIELKPWRLVNEIGWKAAATVADLCKAVDDLVDGNLESGSVAREHRTALRFAADEYKRLAKLLPEHGDPQAVFQRLQILDKAEKLEKLAADVSERSWIDRLVD